MGVQEPAVLCRALQHHWGWQLAWLQLGNDPYLNCNKTKLIAELSNSLRPSCYQLGQEGETLPRFVVFVFWAA